MNIIRKLIDEKGSINDKIEMIQIFDILKIEIKRQSIILLEDQTEKEILIFITGIKFQI